MKFVRDAFKRLWFLHFEWANRVYAKNIMSGCDRHGKVKKGKKRKRMRYWQWENEKLIYGSIIILRIPSFRLIAVCRIVEYDFINLANSCLFVCFLFTLFFFHSHFVFILFCFHSQLNHPLLFCMLRHQFFLTAYWEQTNKQTKETKQLYLIYDFGDADVRFIN